MYYVDSASPDLLASAMTSGDPMETTEHLPYSKLSRVDYPTGGTVV